MTTEISSVIDAIDVNMNKTGMDIINIVRKPKSMILGITCQILLLPALTFLLAISLGDLISPMIALGMLLDSF